MSTTEIGVRSVQGQDLPEIFRWFERRKWPLPPIERIAPEHGFMAEKEGVPIACAWLYCTGRSIAFIEFTGTNPDIPDGIGALGLMRVIEEMKRAAEAMTPSVKALCMYTKNDRLAVQFEELQFKKQEGFHRLLWSTRH